MYFIYNLIGYPASVINISNTNMLDEWYTLLFSLYLRFLRLSLSTVSFNMNRKSVRKLPLVVGKYKRESEELSHEYNYRFL